MEAVIEGSMELLRTQKHDFLNYLQVVSGLMQLGRNQEALDYIKKINQNVLESGAVMRISDKPLSYYLLLAQHQARQQGVEIDISCAEGAGLLKTELKAVQALHLLLAGVTAQLAAEAAAGRDAKLQVTILKGQGAISLDFSASHPIHLDDEARKAVESYGGVSANDAVHFRIDLESVS